MIKRGALLGAAGAVGAVAASGWAPAAAAGTNGTAPLPARRELLVRNAYAVVSMDPAIGTQPRTDMHVRDGIIVAVGPNLRAPGATVIDARDMILMPGMIDTHNHLWNTPERSLTRESDAGKGYYPVTLALGKQYTPVDTYRGVLLGVAELLFGGVTTVHDWSHNIRTPAFADADLQALRDAGIRARFSYGTYQGGPPAEQPMDTAHLEALAKNWKAWSNGGLLTLGLASRSISNSPRGSVTIDVVRQDWAVARRLGIPVTIHVSNADLISRLEREGLLAADVQLVHPKGWTAADIEAIVRSKATACAAPTTDVRLSYGPIGLQELFKRNIAISMSIDTAGVTGALDMFAQMQLLYANQCEIYKDSAGITPRQLLEMVTINGARDLGIADRTGSLTPGKRADAILVRISDLNMAPVTDPVEAIVRCAQPYNVDTVIVDGRILKRAGRLTSIDTAAVVASASDSLQALKQRANLS